MNAAVRAVVRAGFDAGFEMFGVRPGCAGLLERDVLALTARDVGGIVQQGGTVLGSARSSEFKTDMGLRTAQRNLAQRGINALVIIGGNGSQTGAYQLSQRGVLVGLVKGEIAATPLDVVVSSEKPLDRQLLALANVLAK